MRLPRVRFTVRRMMVAVAVIAPYMTAIQADNDFGHFVILWMTPPLLWTSLFAGWRSWAGDAMSGVEWAVFVIFSMIVAIVAAIAMLVVEYVFYRLSTH